MARREFHAPLEVRMARAKADLEGKPSPEVERRHDEAAAFLGIRSGGPRTEQVEGFFLRESERRYYEADAKRRNVPLGQVLRERLGLSGR